MLRAVPLVVALVLAVYSVVDVLQSERRVLGRLGRIGWLALVLLVPVLGPLVWILSARSRAAAAGPAPSGGAPPRRVLAPEDDPDFLRQLRESDTRHERMLEQWEEDLRRRERGLRGDESSDPPPEPPAPAKG